MTGPGGGPAPSATWVRLTLMGWISLLAAATGVNAGTAYAAAPASVDRAQLAAERTIYDRLNEALDFVGAVHTNPDGALSWRSVAGDDSGRIICKRATTTRFTCTWSATLIQSYRGTVRVTARKRGAPEVVFVASHCVNPHHPGITYPNLCALDPVPGMVGR